MTDGASLWTATAGREFPPLEGDARADVVVIGGGIAGLTAARELVNRGRDVLLIEGRRVGRQVTGLSTAKVTSQHALIYSRLERTFGAETAQGYADANQAALERIVATVNDLEIECRLESKTAYTYTTSSERAADLEREAGVAVRLGLPAHYLESAPLPFPVAAAVAFEEQAQFDPYAYLQGLAEHLALPVRIVEGTRVLELAEGEPCRVETDRGTVLAKDVVLATNIPFLNSGFYFARTFPIAHAVIAARLDGTPPDGMFISLDEPSRSIRSAEDGEHSWLVLAGERYRPGTVDTNESWRELEAFARQHFPVTEVGYRWTNEDHQSVDGLPYIGRITSNSEHVYVATGFGGWGITNGTAAGVLLADAITGQPNPWSAVFDSTRRELVASAGSFVKENLKTGMQLIGGRLPGGRSTAAEEARLMALAPGEGITTHLDGQHAAVSRGDDGRLQAVSSICTHQGCVVEWNTGMRTWDCPCHGSSFGADGVVLHGPATEPLEHLELPEALRPADAAT